MERIPLLLDVDTGTDDAICIICALLCQDRLDIQAATAVCGNVSVERTSRNTLDLLRALGSEVPVGKGADKPLVKKLHFAKSHGKTGLGDVVLPASSDTFSDLPACELIYQTARNCGGRLNLLAVGPLTNVALALEAHPDLPELIEQITIMGGGLHGGNMTMTSEFNIYNDPEAAKQVFASGMKLTMVGLDVTLKPKLPQRVVDTLFSQPSPHAKLAVEFLQFMQRRRLTIGGDDPNLHDVMALTAILQPDLFTFEHHYMDVETEGVITRGMTIADFHHVENCPANVRVAVDIDIDGFWTWFVGLFAAADSN